MEKTSPNNWMLDRNHHRAVIYGDAEIQTASRRSLAELALLTDFKSQYKAEEIAAQNNIRNNVADILTYHDVVARNPDGYHCEEALFATASPEALDFLKTYTAETIWRWDWACKRHSQESPFAALAADKISKPKLASDEARLVVEVASAISEVANLGYVPQKMSGQVITNFIRLVLRRSPQYLSDWKQGKLLPQSGNDFGDDGFLTIAELMKIAFTHSKDPVKRYGEIHHHYIDTLSDSNIERIAGGMGKLITTALVPTHRKELARKYSNPEGEVTRVVNRLSGELSTASLAQRYGMSEAEVESYFSMSVRVHACFKQPTNPSAYLDAVMHHVQHTIKPEAIAELLKWDIQEVEQVFDRARLLAWLQRNPTGIVAYIKRVAQNKSYLDDAFIAQKLGIPVEGVNALFTRTCKMDIVGCVNPLVRSREVLKTSVLLERYNLPDGVKRLLAGRRSMRSALELAELIEKEQANCPKDISPRLWASAWASYTGKGSDAQRRQQVAKHVQYFRELGRVMNAIQNPFSFADTATPEDYNRNLGVEMDFDSSFPSETLEQVALAADVDPDELHKLLKYFQLAKEPPVEGVLGDAFIKLKSVLQSKGDLEYS